jgi:hypothetical protein
MCRLTWLVEADQPAALQQQGNTQGQQDTTQHFSTAAAMVAEHATAHYNTLQMWLQQVGVHGMVLRKPCHTLTNKLRAMQALPLQAVTTLLWPAVLQEVLAHCVHVPAHVH